MSERKKKIAKASVRVVLMSQFLLKREKSLWNGLHMAVTALYSSYHRVQLVGRRSP